jgi:predicted nuclease of predicted toxin-antitoxin system
LLDENVRIELAKFLTERGIDFKGAKKSSPDKTLAKMSIAEKRIVVTNDSDFSEMRRGDVFGVVWLRLPQKDTNLLISEFGAMLDDASVRYADSLVTLEPEKRRVSPLPVRILMFKDS